MKMYVIHKSTRVHDGVSYDGAIWDIAGIRHLRRDVYTDYKLAIKIAALLTKFNPVGFSVSKL